MRKQHSLNVRMDLPDRFNLNPIQVSMESFFEFTFWMSEELEDLVAEQRFKRQNQVQANHHETNNPPANHSFRNDLKRNAQVKNSSLRESS